MSGSFEDEPAHSWPLSGGIDIVVGGGGFSLLCEPNNELTLKKKQLVWACPSL